jgi:glutamate dehydrogenase (NAD(P)+)
VVADIEGTIVDENGLDVPHLLSIRDRFGRIDRRRLKPGTRCEPEPAWLSHPVDIMIPAAIGNAIRTNNHAGIHCRLLVEAANNPVTGEAEAELERRGTTILPDFVANAAAAFLFCGLLEKRLEPNLDSIFGVSSRQLRGTTRELLERARRERVSNRRAAEEIAEARLRAHRE